MLMPVIPVLIFGLVETVIIGLLDEIGAITTEDIRSGSELLTQLFSKISESTGVTITKVCFIYYVYM